VNNKDGKMDVATLVRRHQAVSKDNKSTEGGDYLADAKAQLALLNDQRRQVVVLSIKCACLNPLAGAHLFSTP
jgi:hypothetical protein